MGFGGPVNEPFPNGGIINQGAYGNTAEASRSGYGDTNIVAINIENTDCNFEVSYRGETVVSADSQEIIIENIGTLPNNYNIILPFIIQNAFCLIILTKLY